MVKFSVLLKDNSVAEWKDKYIEYENIELALKKAKNAANARDAFAKRRPQLAAEVRAAYETKVKSTSGDSNGREAVPAEEMKGTVEEEPPRRIEAEPLIAVDTDGMSSSRYGSDSELQSYASKLTKLIADVDEAIGEFKELLFCQRDKCRDFYHNKTSNLNKRLDLLIESAKNTPGVIPNPPTSSTDDEKKTPLQRFRGFVLSIIKNEVRADETDSGISGQVSSNTTLFESTNEEGTIDSTDLHDNIREVHSIKRALIDLHRTATLLNNFSMLNYVGVKKILVVFNTNFPDRTIQWNEIMEDPGGYQGKRSQQLALQIEQLFADWFCDHDVTEARSKLLLPKKGDGLETDWSQLRLGYRLGMCFILALWILWDCTWGVLVDGQPSIGAQIGFPVFRACGGILLVHWFWGISIYVFNRFRINYIYLFDFDPKTVNFPLDIFNDCVDETLVYLVIMLIYYKSGAHKMPELVRPGCYPFILFLYTIKCLIIPRRTRAPLWRTMGEVVVAPLVSPTFFHTYVADVFTSMVKVFQDVLFTLCFVLSGDFWLAEKKDNVITHKWQHALWYKNVAIPLVCLFPLWFRFNQCLRRYMDTGKRMPNLANAFKYAMSQTVTLFGAFHPIYLLHGSKGNTLGIELFQAFWLGMFVISSLYSFCWDVYMDWGLGRRKYGFLGPQLIFPSKYVYYCVMAADLVLRFMWVQSLIPPNSGAYFEIPAYLTALNMSLELLRRTLWGFFRLEREHRAHTEGLTLDFVPLHFSTGHDRKDKQDDKRVGWRVLLEVLAVIAILIVVSLLSVIIAREETVKMTNSSEL